MSIALSSLPTIQLLSTNSPVPHQAAWGLGRLIAGMPVEGIGPLPAPWTSILETVQQAPCVDRPFVLNTALAANRLSSDAVITAIAAIDPNNAPPPSPRRTEWTADDLLGSDFPDPRFVVTGWFPTGLMFLGGRPKLGKSWLSLQLAMAVGGNGWFMGRNTSGGKVLYFALEDSPRRLKKRMRLMGWSLGIDVKFFFAMTEVGGLDGLPDLIATQKPTLVVVDTFSRALSPNQHVQQRRGDDMTAVLDPIQQAAIEDDCLVIMVDHHRKPMAGSEGGDHLDELMESTAKVGVADTIAGLFRERGHQTATLKISGRDLEEDQVLAVEWDKSICKWKLEGEGPKASLPGNQRRIVDAFEELGAKATTKQIAGKLGMDEGNVSREIGKLVEGGWLRTLPKEGKEQPYELIQS